MIAAKRLLMTSTTNYTSLLLHGDGANGGTTFTDSSVNGYVPTKAGTVTTSTTAPKFGTASILFGNSGYLYYSTTGKPPLNFGTSDFSIDYWITWSVNVSGYAFYINAGGTNIANILHYTDNRIYIWMGNGYVITSAVQTLNTTPKHIEVSRMGGTLRLFINGTLANSVANSTNLATTGANYVIGSDGTGNFLSGNRIDEYRVQKGGGGHTASFTPPTAAYTE